MNYESMSDFEINKAVANKLGLFVVAVAQDGIIVNGSSLSIDYCNNPSDAWPIINGNSINIKFDGHGGGAFADEYGSVIIRCKNKLRAAMIVFLMMQNG
jgi:hypothetical protein